MTFEPVLSPVVSNPLFLRAASMDFAITPSTYDHVAAGWCYSFTSARLHHRDQPQTLIANTICLPRIGQTGCNCSAINQANCVEIESVVRKRQMFPENELHVVAPDAMRDTAAVRGQGLFFFF